MQFFAVIIWNHEWTRMHTNVRDESTEYTELTESLAAGPSIRWRICLNKMNSECWKCLRLRRLGGCHALRSGKECHAEAHGHEENLREKIRKWTIVVRIPCRWGWQSVKNFLCIYGILNAENSNGSGGSEVSMHFAERFLQKNTRWTDVSEFALSFWL